MEDLLKTFHIEGGLLLAQFINFAIVFAVLYKFAYNPPLKLLKERAKKIEKGLKEAEESHKKLAEISEKAAAVLVEARKKAQEIIKKSEESAAWPSVSRTASAPSLLPPPPPPQAASSVSGTDRDSRGQRPPTK